MFPHAVNFDSMIDQMIAKYFNFKLTSLARLENIAPGSRLDSQQIIQLARFQLRDSEARGGIGLTSMASIIVPAFLAGTSCHILSTVPFLQPDQTLLTKNGSSDLFTSPILFAHAKTVELGAKVLTDDPRASQDQISLNELHLPDLDMFFDSNSAIILPRISKTLRKVSRQKFLTQWAQENSPLLQHVQKVIQADDSLRARMNHLSQCEIKGPHPRFDIPAESCIRYRPTALLGNILSMSNAEFSSGQLALYLRLVLGLEFPPQQTSDGCCHCGKANDSSGFHRLNCPRWAGR